MDQGSEKLAPTVSVWLPMDAIPPMDGAPVIGGKRCDDVPTDRDLEDQPTLDSGAGELGRRRGAQGGVAEPVDATTRPGVAAPTRGDVALAPDHRARCAVCGGAGIVVSAWPP